MQIIKTVFIPLLKYQGKLLFILLSIWLISLVSIYRFIKNLLTFGKQAILPHYNPLISTHESVFKSRYEVIKFEGYKIEEHQFKTEDQAYLFFWRIVPDQPTRKKYDKNERQPIVIQHGLLDSAMSWFLHEKVQNSLPYILAQAGYDVWIGNNRGTRLSSKNSSRKDYWEYSLDHLIKYDFPCLLKSITTYTKSQQLTYIGHSQGATQFFASLSIHPQLQSKIKCFVGLGPVISLHGVSDHTIIKIVDKTRICQVLSFLGFDNMLILPYWMSALFGILVYNGQLYYKILHFIVKQLCGTNTASLKITQERFGAILAHEPGGSSINNVLHWIQMYRNGGTLKKFDHGKKKNLEIYGTHQVPDYKFDKLIDVPFNLHLFKGTSDRVLSQQNISFLKSKLPANKCFVHEVQDFAHLDYLWSHQATQTIYKNIIELLNCSSELSELDQTNQAD